MDDDEEIQSHPSPEGSESPSSPPHHNDQVTVTVAAAGPTPPRPQNSLTLALPIQSRTSGGSGGGGGGGGGGGREDCWSEGATSVLVDAWGERYLELSRGNLKQKHWKEVADIVSSREDYKKAPKTDIQCKNRIDTVKKKYKIERAKITSSGGSSKWPFYDRLDRLIGPTAKVPSPAVSTAAAAAAASSHAVYNSSSQKVPVGIPVGVRSLHHFQLPQQPSLKQQFPSSRGLNQRINSSQNKTNANANANAKQQQQLGRRRPPVDSDSEPDDPSPDSTDSFPPETFKRQKRPKVEFNGAGARAERGGAGGSRGGERKEREKGWGNSVRELTRAILKFGEAYEQAESAKMVQLMEMEKQRMKFTKELEIQRMKFLMKTQLELSQLNRNSRSFGDGNNNLHQHHSNNDNINNSDSSS
ncbi:hypothetical protein Ancab_029303 [Ancistrocladus abbreviatus]